MWTDTIVEEVRRTREKILEEYDNDINKYIEYIYECQKKNADRLVTLPLETNNIQIKYPEYEPLLEKVSEPSENYEK